MKTIKNNEPMKTKKKTAAETMTIEYNPFMKEVTVNNESIPVNTEWSSRTYQDSYFRSIADRDAMAEHYIRSINALLIDYHYHHRELNVFDPFWETWIDLIDDKDTEEVSLSILREAAEQNALLLQTCFKDGWKTRRKYIEAALCLLYEINKQRRELGRFSFFSSDLEHSLQAAC